MFVKPFRDHCSSTSKSKSFSLINRLPLLKPTLVVFLIPAFSSSYIVEQCVQMYKYKYLRNDKTIKLFLFFLREFKTEIHGR